MSDFIKEHKFKVLAGFGVLLMLYAFSSPFVLIFLIGTLCILIGVLLHNKEIPSGMRPNSIRLHFLSKSDIKFNDESTLDIRKEFSKMYDCDVSRVSVINKEFLGEFAKVIPNELENGDFSFICLAGGDAKEMYEQDSNIIGIHSLRSEGYTFLDESVNCTLHKLYVWNNKLLGVDLDDISDMSQIVSI